MLLRAGAELALSAPVEVLQGDTFLIRAVFLSIKVPYFSNSCTKRESNSAHLALAAVAAALSMSSVASIESRENKPAAALTAERSVIGRLEGGPFG
eukprot:SAG31_NODE_2474_length_5640_cov_8.231144_1_plen_96_part_00